MWDEVPYHNGTKFAAGLTRTRDPQSPEDYESKSIARVAAKLRKTRDPRCKDIPEGHLERTN